MRIQQIKTICQLACAGFIAWFGASSGLWAANGDAGSWQPIECVPTDPPVEALYETAQSIDDFEAPALRWQAEKGGQQAKAEVQLDAAERHDGVASLRVDYEFAGKKDYEYIQINSKAEIPKPGLGFGFWIRHDGTPFSVRLRIVDAGGEWHQVDLMTQARPGWQFAAGMIDSRSTAWGGDGNKRRDYPCKLAGICIDRPSVGFTGKGSLWIDSIGFLTPRKRSATLKVEAQTLSFGNLFAIGEQASLHARGDGDVIHWRVADFFGKPLSSGSGPAAQTEIHFPLDQPGYLACAIDLVKDGRVEETREYRCAVLPGDKTAAASDFAGVCTHFGQNAYPLEIMELMRRYGIDQFRDEISWGTYERAKGAYAMPAHAAAFLKRAVEQKMRPLLIFDYANALYENGHFPNADETIAAFASYAVDLARQTRGMVQMFEVWNEWAGGCGMEGRSGRHDGEAYGRLLKPAYLAVKKAFPDLTVVGIGGEYGAQCAENILGAVRTAGPDAMDAWSIHPYRYPHSPEKSDLTGEVDRISKQAAGAGVKTKAWITEIGYPTHRTPGGSDEAAQARLCVRTMALLQSTRQVDKVFWYDLKDDGLDRDYNENNFGLVRHQQYNCAPKPGMVALAVFIRMTAQAQAQGVARQGDAWIVTYKKQSGGELRIAWMKKGSGKMMVAEKPESAFDLMGNSFSPGVGISLDENPVYIHVK